MSTQTGAAGSHSDEVAFGLDENIAAVVGYIVAIVFPILLLAKEKDSEFVRFHAAQSLVLGLMIVGAFVAITLVVSVAGVATLGMLNMVVSLCGALATLFLAYQAYQGNRFEFPVLAGFARGLV